VHLSREDLVGFPVELELAFGHRKSMSGGRGLVLGWGKGRAGEESGQKQNGTHCRNDIALVRSGGPFCSSRLQRLATLDASSHPTGMRIFKLIALVAVGLVGCTTHDRSPDAIREQTAHATSTAVRDAKAVTQGIVQGIRQQKTININKASVKDLSSLEGIDDATANRIVEHRPYADSYELVKKHLISNAEYKRIAGKIEAR